MDFNFKQHYKIMSSLTSALLNYCVCVIQQSDNWVNLLNYDAIGVIDIDAEIWMKNMRDNGLRSEQTCFIYQI